MDRPCVNCEESVAYCPRHAWKEGLIPLEPAQRTLCNTSWHVVHILKSYYTSLDDANRNYVRPLTYVGKLHKTLLVGLQTADVELIFASLDLRLKLCAELLKDLYDLHLKCGLVQFSQAVPALLLYYVRQWIGPYSHIMTILDDLIAR